MNKKFQHIKLVACDVDGTLLHFNGISQRSIDAIHRTVDLGIPVTLATGREFDSASQIQSYLGLQGPLVCNNGSLVRDHETIYYSATLPAGFSQTAYQFAREHAFVVMFFTHNAIYMPVQNIPSEQYFSSDFGSGSFDSNSFFALDDPTEIDQKLQLPQHKICFFSEYPESLQKARQAFSLRLQNSPFSQDCAITSSFSNNIELMPANITKGTGIRALAEYHGVSMDEIMVFGDNENDLGMFESVPHSVAMGNAPQYVKSAAQYVTDTVENGGVGIALEKYLLP